jgi:hypothetical protein
MNDDGHDLRAAAVSVPAALAVGAAAALAYFVAAGMLVLSLDFWHVTSNQVAPLAVLVAAAAGVGFPHRRVLALALAAVLPPAAVMITFALVDPPYIRQNLGLSQTAGHALLVVIPGVMAELAATLLARSRPALRA